MFPAVREEIELGGASSTGWAQYLGRARQRLPGSAATYGPDDRNRRLSTRGQIISEARGRFPRSPGIGPSRDRRTRSSATGPDDRAPPHCADSGALSSAAGPRTDRVSAAAALRRIGGAVGKPAYCFRPAGRVVGDDLAIGESQDRNPRRRRVPLLRFGVTLLAPADDRTRGDPLVRRRLSGATHSSPTRSSATPPRRWRMRSLGNASCNQTPAAWSGLWWCSSGF